VPKVNTPEYKEWFAETRKFGKAIWEITGKGVNVDIVFEHPGEATFPVSTFVCKRGGMVVICAGTTGFNCTFDVRHMWIAPEAPAGLAFRASQAGRGREPADDRAAARSLHVRGVPLGRDPAGAHEDAEERAQARQHGGAGAGAEDRAADARRRAGGAPGGLTGTRSRSADALGPVRWRRAFFCATNSVDKGLRLRRLAIFGELISANFSTPGHKL
jgi:hypothetical protein